MNKFKLHIKLLGWEELIWVSGITYGTIFFYSEMPLISLMIGKEHTKNTIYHQYLSKQHIKPGSITSTIARIVHHRKVRSKKLEFLCVRVQALLKLHIMTSLLALFSLCPSWWPIYFKKRLNKINYYQVNILTCIFNSP